MVFFCSLVFVCKWEKERTDAEENKKIKKKTKKKK